MRFQRDRLLLAPTDLSGYLNCRHLTALDLRAAKGEFERPTAYGPVIEAGNPDGSLLIDMIASGDMPEEGDPVTPEELEVIKAWIAEGAENN